MSRARLVALLAAVVAASGAAAQPQGKAPDLNAIAAEASRLRRVVEARPRDEKARQRLADLAILAARGAEQALASGETRLFDAYRAQVREHFHDTLWRLGRMAKQGSAGAEYAQGVLLLHGMLETASAERACGHFMRALEAGEAAARLRASQCLLGRDPERAARLLREAADTGNPMAEELQARACLASKPPDASCAVQRAQASAAAGRASAQSLLGWMYAEGVGVTKDLTRAFRLYDQAARKGDASAQNNLAELYETGRGIAADPARARELYRRSAEGGFAAGQYNFGRALAGGVGGPEDRAAAVAWLEKAAAAGVAPARKLIDWLNAGEPSR